MEDILDKKTIIVNGSDTSNITLDIDPIKNVNSIKLVETYANLGTNATELTKIYICINDYALKTIYSNDNNNTIATNIFSNIIFFNTIQVANNKKLILTSKCIMMHFVISYFLSKTSFR